MHSGIDIRTSKAGWIAVGLMTLQLIIKLTLEITKAGEASEPGILAVAVAFAIGWAAIIPLCLSGRRIGYWAGAIWGLLHSILTPAVPILGMCDHDGFAAFVSVHGLAITAANLVVLLLDRREQNLAPYLSPNRADRLILILLFVSILLRTSWITLVEPRGAVRTQNVWAGAGGAASMAAASIVYIVVASMVSLCFILPGVVMKRGWAFIAVAILGGIHVVLTSSIVVMRMSHPMQTHGAFMQVGPYLVITASLGMLLGGIGMLKTRSNASDTQA